MTVHAARGGAIAKVLNSVDDLGTVDGKKVLQLVQNEAEKNAKEYKEASAVKPSMKPMGGLGNAAARYATTASAYTKQLTKTDPAELLADVILALKDSKAAFGALAQLIKKTAPETPTASF